MRDDRETYAGPGNLAQDTPDREVFNATSDALFIHDETGRIVDVNDRMCAMFRCDREAALTLSLSEMCLGESPYAPPDAREKVARAISEGPQVFEWLSRRRTGEVFPTEVALRAYGSPERRRVIASVRDITERKRAEKALTARAAFDELLNELLTQFAGSVTGDLDAILRTALERVGRFFGVECTFVTVLAANGASWSVEHEWCGPGVASLKARFRNMPMGTTPWSEALILAGKPYVFRRIGDLPEVARPFHEALGTKSSLQVPIAGPGGQVRGLLAVTSREREVDWTDHDVRSLLMLGSAVGAVLERRAADAKLERLNRELLAVRECNQTLVRATDEQELLNAICQTIHESAGYRVVWVALATPEGKLRPVAHAGFPMDPFPPSLLERTSREHAPPAAVVMETGKVCCIQDVSQAEDFPLAWRTLALSTGSQSTLTLPLLNDEGRPFGVLAIRSGELHAYPETEVRLLTELAGDLAFGIMGLRSRAAGRRAEEALRTSEARYRALFETANDGVFILDHQGFILCNERALEIFGCTREQLLGKRPEDFSPPQQPDGSDSRTGARARLASAFAGQPQSFVWMHCRQDGTPFHAEVSLNAVVVEGGTLLQGIVRDVESRVQLEREREAMAQRAAHSQKLEAVGTLAGGIAHDFNNILGAIMGYAEVALLQLPPESETRQDVEGIFQAGTRATSLVKQILSFSRQTRREPHPTRLLPIVKEALALLRATLPSTIDIQTQLKTDGLVTGDATELHQILMNLCTNAAHAMRDTGGVLSLSLSEVDLDDGFLRSAAQLGSRSPGRYVGLEVKDTGIGMAREVVLRIFEPFFTTRQEGTGLGLSVVHGLVSSQGGFVTVDSAVGVGSTFCVYWPRLDAEAEIAGVSARPVRGTESVLVVDDEVPLFELAVKGLKTLGYRAVGFTSSHDALAAFRAAPESFDIVVTDMTMPGMTGESLANAIREVRPDIPIVLATGYSERMTAARAKEINVHLMTKPLLLSDLSSAIRELCRRPQ